jgi:hypothetical protein
MGADNIDGFLHAPAFGHHVFDHQHFFIGCDFESAPQDQFAFFLFGEDEAKTQLAGDLLADDQSAQGGRDDRGRAQAAHLGRQRAAQAFDDRHFLQGQRALEILAAVQAAAENEMPFQQRARLAENLQCLFARHPALYGVAARG